MQTPPPSILLALRGRCPRCGNGTLFRTWVGFESRCRACALDFAGFNVGDGPAALLILVIGALITGLAIALELGVHPPFWVHILLWLPLTTLAVIFSLRFAKALLLILEYRNQAAEGRIAADE
jgi:uncharacterized protein (DUF983 family)